MFNAADIVMSIEQMYLTAFMTLFLFRDLSCNQLSGPIPPILGNLSYTEKL